MAGGHKKLIKIASNQYVNLTELQAKFVESMTRVPGCIGNVKRSAERAGYTNGNMGYVAIGTPEVQRAIRIMLTHQISGDLASKAVEVLHFILHDEKSPPKLKLEAAKTVLDRAGYVAPKEAADPERKRPEDMSIEELEAFIRRGRQAQVQADDPIIEGEVTPDEDENQS